MLAQNQIEETLHLFDPISLKEMDSVELMNRTDAKYVFSIGQLPVILNEAKSKYKVLEINNQRLFSYTTTYYDTSSFTLFNHHIAGRLNRHKIRHRTYDSTGVTYLEVKFKTNKNRTIKWRIKNEKNGHFDQNAAEFLNSRIKINYQSLSPVVTNCFKRITLVSIEDKTRITLDFQISFQGSNGLEKALPYLAIAEVKQEGYNSNNEFIRILRRNGIRPEGFSKYCVGSALICDIPRKNLLKAKFLYLNRIQKNYDTNSLITLEN